jgi:RNA polymerase sigma-32 factor
MATYANLPAPSPEQGLNRYLQEIRKFPMLEPEQEYMLAKRWVEDQDTEAAHQMVTSHLRLAAKIAMGYRGYGLPQAEVISEANVGLMQAVKRFDPEKGFRLATYAMWWIRAAIQEYILRSWSLVKLGTTSAQKKLFFNLRKAKARIGALEEGDLRPENVARIAHDLGVTEDRGDLDEPAPVGGRCLAQRHVGSEDDGLHPMAGLAGGRGRQPGRRLRRAGRIHPAPRPDGRGDGGPERAGAGHPDPAPPAGQSR